MPKEPSNYLIEPSERSAPLLKALWLLILAIVCSSYTKGLLPSFLCFGFGAISLMVGLFLKKRIAALWYPLASPCLYIGIFAVALGYTTYRQAPLPQSPTLPPREVFLTIKLDRLFNSPPTDAYPLKAIAKVTEAPPHLTFLNEMPIAISLRAQAPLPTQGSLGTVKGVLTSTLREDASAFQHYLSQSGIYYELRRGSWLTTLKPPPVSQHLLEQINTQLENTLNINANENGFTNIYTAMLLGKTALLTPSQKAAFVQTGTLHLFAISGLHIAVICGVLFFCLRRLPLPEWAIVIIGLLLLCLYVEATGGAPSARRAFLMVSFIWGGVALKRQASPFAGLVAAAFLTLLWSPYLLYHVGFQLSYSVVAALLLYGIPLGRYLKSRYPLWPHHPVAKKLPWWRTTSIALYNTFINAFALSFAATLISTPLIIHYFNLFSPIGLFINLLLIPLASLVIIIGFISLCTGLLGVAFMPYTLNPIANLLLSIITPIVEAAATIPGAYWQIPRAEAALGPLLTLGLLSVCFYTRAPTLQKPGYLLWALGLWFSGLLCAL